MALDIEGMFLSKDPKVRHLAHELLKVIITYKDENTTNINIPDFKKCDQCGANIRLGYDYAVHYQYFAKYHKTVLRERTCCSDKCLIILLQKEATSK
jgi:hypothetical protein